MPNTLVDQARALEDEARDALVEGSRAKAEQKFRGAIEKYVDAFLFDRRGQADCFTKAHELGRRLSDEFGCDLDSGDGGNSWGVECGVLALHQRLGMSWAGVTRGRCSICNAEDFGCTHVPGRQYDGSRCFREVYEVSLDEVSLVQFPEDPRCYRVFTRRPVREIEAAFGGPLPPGIIPVCTHCETCPGADHGPSEEDVDQSLWDPIAPQLDAGDLHPGDLEH